MSQLIGVICILFFLSCNNAVRTRYDNYNLFKLTPNNEGSVKQLKSLQHNQLGYDFWTPVRTTGIPVDVMVPPELKEYFLNSIKDFDIEYEVQMDNVQNFIDSAEYRDTKKNVGFSWDAYYTLEEINSWLSSLAQQNPETVTTFIAGHTYEGRDIMGAKVSFNPNNDNRGVFIEANIHAREWIANAVATYILNEVLTGQDADFRRVVESFDWYVLPVANPDGYVYTHTEDRLWRKTRVPYDNCFGADPNRNWDWHWSEVGASNNPCDETYAGPSAFSEPSTESLSQFLSTIADKLKVYIDFHSYSQLMMVPYGNTFDHLDNYNVTVPLGHKAAEALSRRYGTEYKVGNIAETVYMASGGSVDWVKGNFHVPYVYAYELRDTGKYGFLLPPSLIIPTGEETLDSLVVILEGALANPEGK